MGQNKPQPFTPFGLALKHHREKESKSQAEVSGAVEIDQQILSSFESGESRPSEDILFLLIQHFNLEGKEADELWRLAGYTNMTSDDTQYFINDEIGGAKETHTAAITQEEAKIIYTDMIQVMVNNYGVILNFMQGAGSGNQPLGVARVGMSREHALSVLEVLKKTLEKADDMSAVKRSAPSRLPSGKKTKD